MLAQRCGHGSAMGQTSPEQSDGSRTMNASVVLQEIDASLPKADGIRVRLG